jgi:hypothetical protein
MFNHQAIDKTPTVIQIKAIIKYMEDEPNIEFDFTKMMTMQRPELNKIIVDLNDAHVGKMYEVLFNEENQIISFKFDGMWMS